MPYNIWCGGCGNHIGMGTSIDNRKALKVRKIIENSLLGYSLVLYMARVHSCCNKHSDWLTLWLFSPAMPMSQLWACKYQAKSHITGLLKGRRKYQISWDFQRLIREKAGGFCQRVSALPLVF